MNCEKSKRVYLSYMKASCNDYAAEIAGSLRCSGYSVYYNKKSPRSGEFDKELCKAVNNSRWFVIILDKYIFEDWNNEKNWIHTELSKAISEKKRIIAVKTPGFNLEKEIPEELYGVLFTNSEDVTELDTKHPERTARVIQDIIEKRDSIGKLEKTLNRIFSGIYLWRIALFPVLGVFLMLGHLSSFYNMYLSGSNVEVGYIFKRFGVPAVYTFNLLYIILGAIFCGVFMYITKKKLKLDIIPLFLADVAGVTVLSMLARKITDMIFGLGKACYWANPMGETVWMLSERLAVFMVLLTVIIQLVLWGVKRSLDFV